MSEQYGSRGTRGHSGSREQRPGDEAWLAERDEFTRSREGVADRPLSGLSRHEDDGARGGAGSRRRAADGYDREYAQWRDEQLHRFDEDYEVWRQERYRRFSQEFGQWRDGRARDRR